MYIFYSVAAVHIYIYFFPLLHNLGTKNSRLKKVLFETSQEVPGTLRKLSSVTLESIRTLFWLW